ncbi:hypothetical protein HK100_012008 [Physocladia obscura]|uniref:Uncharacterized protein n=1 Tax=Physocladia obscura TaxID=109957 RepID=A0AAD5T6F0_9FUNG|nr:hypothetical protein HK100_012008 [Physocladia obscura]
MGASSVSLLSQQSQSTNSNNRIHTLAKKVSTATTAVFANTASQNSQHLQMTPEAIEHGSTLKKTKTESLAAFLRRVTHVSLVGKGIRVMEGMEMCKNLSVLYLYENKIQRIEGLACCLNLSRLYLQNNQIEEISGLDFDCGMLEKLTELHLTGNKIKHVTGLHNLPALEIFHVDNQRTENPVTFDSTCMDAIGMTVQKFTAAGNKIKEITALSGLIALEELDLSNNDISEWEGVNNILGSCNQLQSLNISGNPVSGILKIRQKVILASSTLVTLNEKNIPNIEREFLYNMETAKKHRSTKHQKDLNPCNISTMNISQQQIFELTMLRTNEFQKPIPHLPPYASQYRDLMLHQIAVANGPSNNNFNTAGFPLPRHDQHLKKNAVFLPKTNNAAVAEFENVNNNSRGVNMLKYNSGALESVGDGGGGVFSDGGSIMGHQLNVSDYAQNFDSVGYHAGIGAFAGGHSVD